MDNLEQSYDSVLHHRKKNKITQGLPLSSIDILLPAGHTLDLHIPNETMQCLALM